MMCILNRSGGHTSKRLQVESDQLYLGVCTETHRSTKKGEVHLTWRTPLDSGHSKKQRHHFANGFANLLVAQMIKNPLAMQET